MSSDDVSRDLPAACGYEFRIDRDLGNMPDAGPMQARAPVAAEHCETPVQLALSEAPPLSDLDIGQSGVFGEQSLLTHFAFLTALDRALPGKRLIAGRVTAVDRSREANKSSGEVLAIIEARLTGHIGA